MAICEIAHEQFHLCHIDFKSRLLQRRLKAFIGGKGLIPNLTYVMVTKKNHLTVTFLLITQNIRCIMGQMMLLNNEMHTMSMVLISVCIHVTNKGSSIEKLVLKLNIILIVCPYFTDSESKKQKVIGEIHTSEERSWRRKPWP